MWDDITPLPALGYFLCSAMQRRLEIWETLHTAGQPASEVHPGAEGHQTQKTSCPPPPPTSNLWCMPRSHIWLFKIIVFKRIHLFSIGNAFTKDKEIKQYQKEMLCEGRLSAPCPAGSQPFGFSSQRDHHEYFLKILLEIVYIQGDIYLLLPPWLHAHVSTNDTTHEVLQLTFLFNLTVYHGSLHISSQNSVSFLMDTLYSVL